MLPCPLCPYAAGPGASPQPERRYCNLGQDPADFSDNYHTSVRPTRLFLRGHSGQDRLLRCRRRRVPSQTGQTYQGQQASQSRGILDRIGQDRATKRTNEHTSSSSTCSALYLSQVYAYEHQPYTRGRSNLWVGLSQPTYTLTSSYFASTLAPSYHPITPSPVDTTAAVLTHCLPAVLHDRESSRGDRSSGVSCLYVGITHRYPSAYEWAYPVLALPRTGLDWIDRIPSSGSGAEYLTEW